LRSVSPRLALSLAVALASTAMVAVTFPASASAAVTQTATCTDQGKHKWNLRAVWGAEYRNKAGVKRIRVDAVGFTSADPEATTVDYSIKVYNGAGKRLSTQAQSDRKFKFKGGTAYLSRNPRNPPSSPGKAKIIVSVGDGNDGYGNCTMPFVQPGASQTPNPPAPPPGAGVCTNPYFTTSGSNGGITDGAYYVHNNLWNASGYPGTKGTTQVCSFHSWNHIGTASNNGDGAVKTYPNVHKDYSGRKISSFSRLTSTFAATSPGVGIYNVGYDLWLNGVPNDELMIWTDSRKQVPAGSKVASNVKVGGHTRDVYATGGNGGKPATWKFTNFSITDS